MNFSFDFYWRMKQDLPEAAYLKAFEIAKYLEMQPRRNWADIIHQLCNHPEYSEGWGGTIENWYNCNLIWR